MVPPRLPENAFGKFVEAEACEIHLATNFANIFFDLIPADLKETDVCVP